MKSKIIKYSIILISAFALSSCIEYREAPKIFYASKIINNQNKELKIGLQPNDKKKSKTTQGETFEAVELEKVYNYISSYDGYSGMTPIVIQLFTTSEDVCKEYIYHLIDTREYINIGNEVASQVASIFSVFGVAAETTTRITDVATHSRSIANSYFLQDQLVNEKFTEILTDREKFKRMILLAWETNATNDKEKIEAGNYSILKLLSDIDRYHKACSFYDNIYLNGNNDTINDKVQQYFAYNISLNSKTSELASILGFDIVTASTTD